MNQELLTYLKNFATSGERITILTGAGVSAESGIPTFRGPEGYWTIGSTEYHPMEMATYQMFRCQPDEVWTWYLFRMGVCRKALPNPGHTALVKMEKLFADRFTLITQNVDNLHIRAGNSLERTYQIHGNVFFMRCSDGCTSDIIPLPVELSAKTKGESLTPEERRLLTCERCGSLTRPHVLWFDETYNEEHFRLSSSLRVAKDTELLIVAGTSGATNLPNQIVNEVRAHNGMILDINIEENPFSKLALSGRGYFLKMPSAQALPNIFKTWMS